MNISDLFGVLPEIILYLSSGFLFVCGFYFLIDRRFDFFSDISFSIMLIIGFVINNILQLIPKNFNFQDANLRNICILIISLALGVAFAEARNLIGNNLSGFVIKHGRRKTTSRNFWYDILDEKDKGVQLRLINNKENTILEGILLSLSEDEKDPYLILGYTKKYDLEYKLTENIYEKKKNIKRIIKANHFDEIIVFYEEDSDRNIKFDYDEG